MIRKLTYYFLLSFLLLQSCKTRQPVISEKPTEVLRSMEPQDLPVYRATTTTLFDLVHTSLKVSFDWNKKYLFGKAEITLHPHFYPTNILILNARGMQINEVGLLKSSNKKTLEYQYQNDSLIITLDRIYQRNEELKIFIDYVAKPEELDSVGGSAAITSDKGLYFINAEGKDKFKPRQIWTQGETQSNSVW